MGQIIQAKEPGKLTEAETRLRKIERESDEMEVAAITCDKLSQLLRIGLIYNYQTQALYRLKGFKSFNEWLAARGFGNERTGRRYKAIGEAMTKFCGEEDNAEFIFTRANIKEHFGESLKASTTIRGLAAAANDAIQFRNYLNGESDISASTALKLVGGDNSTKPKELGEGGYDSQASLFGMHDAILKAGYIWDKERGGYTHEDGTPMSLDEMGEFVDDETGMLIFRETEKVLDKTSSDLVKTIERVSIFFQAYNKKHHSPEFKKLVKERHREVSSKAKDLLAYVGAMLEGDDE